MPLQPEQPDEWNRYDFAATALYFTKALNPDSPTRYGTVLQMKNLLFNMMVFHSLPRSFGGNWQDEEGNIVVDSAAYRTTLELYRMLYDAGATRFLQWLSTEEAALLYARAGGAPALSENVAAKLASERPDLIPLGEFASTYGFVMPGGHVCQGTIRL